MTKNILNEVLAHLNNTQNLIQQLYDQNIIDNPKFIDSNSNSIEKFEQTNNSKKALLLNNILLTLQDYSNKLLQLKNNFENNNIDSNTLLSLSEEDLYRVNEIKSYSNMILQNYSKPL